MITHIFFDLHGTLINGAQLHPCYSSKMGDILSQRYGTPAEAWTNANRQIMLDWDSYYADLNLSGEDGLAHYYEGLYRTTRAMFRLTQTPEPPAAELQQLAHDLPGLITPHCDGFYDDAKTVIPALYAKGYTLGVTTHALHAQAVGLLQGGGMQHYFTGEIIGIDTLEQYEKDALYFRQVSTRAGASPDACLIVDDVPRYVRAATHAGMHAAFITRRKPPRRLPPVRYMLGDTLAGLLDHLPPITPTAD